MQSFFAKIFAMFLPDFLGNNLIDNITEKDPANAR